MDSGKTTAPETGYRAAVVVCSDRASSGVYRDESGEVAAQWLRVHGFALGTLQVVADSAAAITAALGENLPAVDLVVMSGGTGLGERDVTPQTLERFCEYQVPGIGELLRQGSLQYSKNAYLSRCGGWIKDQKLILALPGNPKAVKEQLDLLADLLPSVLAALRGTCNHRHRRDA